MKPTGLVAVVLAGLALAGCTSSDRENQAHMFAVSHDVFVRDEVSVICSSNETVGVVNLSVRNDGPKQAFDIAVHFQSENESLPRVRVTEITTIPVDAVRTVDGFVVLRESCGPAGAYDTFRGTFTVNPSNGPAVTAEGSWSCLWERYGNQTYYASLAGTLHCA